MDTLSRFHDAQAPVYDRALDELHSGAKRSHWMWFIFPQLRGLGRSHMATFFGLADLAEAQAYLADPVLGPRLSDCAAAVLSHPDKAAEAIMGGIDAVKLRSCATLFEAAGGGPEFGALLDAFYGGARCPRTLALLREGAGREG